MFCKTCSVSVDGIHKTSWDVMSMLAPVAAPPSGWCALSFAKHTERATLGPMGGCALFYLKHRMV